MRARLISTAAVLLLAVCSASSASAATHCPPAGARVMASGRQARVYARNGSVYACEVQTGKRLRLGTSRICNVSACIDRAAVAGDLVAYGAERFGIDTGSASVSVLRLSDGKRLHSYAAVNGPIGPEAYQAVNALVVNRSADVGWVATATSIIGRGKRTEVHGDGQLLDSGPGIVASSLKLHGSTLTWRDGTVTRSATL